MTPRPEADSPAAWRDMLKGDEIDRVAFLEAKAKELEAERMTISAELSRIRVRCYKRRYASHPPTKK